MHDSLTQGLASTKATAQDGEVRQSDKESKEVSGKFRFCKKAVECETDESARHRGNDNIDQKSKNAAPETRHHSCGQFNDR
jgi:hypothetical protein